MRNTKNTTFLKNTTIIVKESQFKKKKINRIAAAFPNLAFPQPTILSHMMRHGHAVVPAVSLFV